MYTTTTHKLYSVDKLVAYMYVELAGTYQQFFSIDIAYYMQIIDAILSPCNRWDNIQKGRKEKKHKEWWSIPPRGGGAEGGWGDKAKSGQLTTSHTTRIQERDEEERKWLHRSKQRCTFKTPVIYKNKVRLGGASELGTGAAASPAWRVCKSEHQPQIQLHWFPAFLSKPMRFSNVL